MIDLLTKTSIWAPHIQLGLSYLADRNNGRQHSLPNRLVEYELGDDSTVYRMLNDRTTFYQICALWFGRQVLAEGLQTDFHLSCLLLKYIYIYEVQLPLVSYVTLLNCGEKVVSPNRKPMHGWREVSEQWTMQSTGRHLQVKSFKHVGNGTLYPKRLWFTYINQSAFPSLEIILRF